MDEIFNLLRSPAFWFGSLVSVLLSILANRLDKFVPPVSMRWVTALIWFYGASAILITGHAIAAGYPSFFALPRTNPFETTWARDFHYYYPSFLFAAVVPFFLEYLGVAAPERTFKTAKLFLGALILLLFGAVCYQVLDKRGWTGEVFNVYQLLTFAVAFAGALGTALIALIFWAYGAGYSLLKRVRLI